MATELSTKAEEIKSQFFHHHLHHAPDKVVKAKGNYLHLANGKSVFDATSGAAVACLGHGNDEVKQAVMDQMDDCSYTLTYMFTTSGTEALADELIASTGGKMSMAYIVGSGSEAAEAAMKLTRQYYLEMTPPQPKRVNFIARKESYHGTTLGALSLGGHVTRRKKFEPMLLKNISRVSPCNAYRFQKEDETTEQYVARLAQELEDEFQRLGPETVCAFICEPVVGAASGCVPSVPGYIAAMRDVCHRHGALFILDEVMCGMGRTGTLHAWEQEGVVPDLSTIGKGLGAGFMPIAGVMVGQKVVDVLTKGTGMFTHGHTYQGHPVACAAATAVQKIVKRDNLMENVRARGAELEAGLKARLGSHPHVGNIRGRGLFWGIEFVEDKATKKPFPPALTVGSLVNVRGMAPRPGDIAISIYPGQGTADGETGDHVLLAPPYNITKEDVEVIVDLTAKAVEDVFEELKKKQAIA